MPVLRPFATRPGVAVAVLAALAAAVPAAEPPARRRGAGPLTIAHRVLAQATVVHPGAQGPGACQAWQVDYLLRNDAAEPLVARPAEVVAHVQGWVSNSRVASHATPRLSELTLAGSSGLVGAAEVIPSTDPDLRCRERGVLQVWAGAAGEEPPDPIARAAGRPVAPEEQPTLAVPPGGTLHVRLRLEHEHFLYGPYDPLLGPRSLDLRLGPAHLCDTLPLVRARGPARPDPEWPPFDKGRAPADRLDTRIYLTAPDSLHLEAHVPGNQSHRFPERPVRYATKYRLSYWYLIAPGTEGECRARVAQYRDGSVWKVLPEGDHEQTLAVVGRWTRVDRVFRTEPDATSLLLEFRMHDASVGDLWVDDVRLEPLGEAADGP